MTIRRETIVLRQGETYVVELSDAAYLVRSGRVELRLYPEGGKYGRYAAQPLREAAVGEVVPAFRYQDADYQCWRMSFIALEETELSLMEGASTKPLRNRFLASVGIEDVASQGFEDSLVDRYLESYVKGVVHIARSEKDKRQVSRETQRLVEAPLQGGATAVAPDEASLGDVVGYCLRDVSVKSIVLALLLAAVSAVFSLLVPQYAVTLYDVFLPMSDTAAIGMVGLAVVGGMLANVAVALVRAACARRVSLDARCGVRRRLYRGVFDLPARTLRMRGSAEAVRDVEALGNLAGNVATALVSVLIGLVVGVIVACQMVFKNPVLAVLVVALGLTGGLAAYALTTRRLLHESQQGRVASVGASMMYWFLAGIEKVRSAGFEVRAINAYTKSLVESREQEAAASRFATLEQALSIVFSGLGVALLCAMVPAVAASAGEFVAFALFCGLFFGAAREVALGAARFRRLRALFARYREVAGVAEQGVPSRERVEHLAGEIDIHQVRFAYGPDAETVLDGISLHIAPGERVGIVGKPGCGKSTLLKLLIGLEQPDAGEIRFDGKDVATLDAASLRQRMGVVLQDGQLVPGSIYENIALVAPGIGEDAVNRAVDAAGLRADVAQMPMGLATLVGESGKLLSGGQRQRVLLARALVNDPDIILLDEATSALDPLLQAQVMHTLEQRLCTQVIITHRPETLAYCDRVFTLDSGQLTKGDSPLLSTL